ncbi:hypothetical protein LDFHOB_01520 [Candidatus Electronema aureum]
MNESINMLLMTSSTEELCISIYAAEKKRKLMAALTDGARLKTGSREIIAPTSLKNVLGLVIGRWIR